MTINYIKYKDPRALNNTTFESVKELDKQKAKDVEVVGFLVQEDDENLYLAMQVIGNIFRKVLFVPKRNIVARVENYKDVNIKEISFTDCQMTSTTSSISLDKLKALGKPSDVNTVGYLVRETEDDTVLAMERSEEGNFRTIVIIPKIK